jgi:predicted O-linked N-acetylglucosamine transferase (SPINDLY family)
MGRTKLRGKIPPAPASGFGTPALAPAPAMPAGAAPSPITDPGGLFDQALAAHLSGSLAEAQQGYESYLERLGSLPVVRTNLAGIYLNQGRLDEAERLLNLALTEWPDYSEALSNRGYLAVLRGQPEQAVSDLERALQASPALAAALTNLLPIYRQQGRDREALALLERALAANVDAIALHDLKAQLLHTLEGPAAATAHLDAVRTRFEGVDRAALESVRGKILLAAGTDLPATLAAFEAAIAASTKPQVHDLINKGEVLRKLNRHGEAFDWVNACLSSEGDIGGLLNLKACILQDLRQFDEAITLYKMAVDAEPFNPLFYANLGFLHSDLGSHQQAIQIFRAGLDYSPFFNSLQHGMAQAHFHLGKPAAAYYHYKLAVQAAPDHLNVWDNFLYFLSFVRTIPGEKVLEHCQVYAEQALAQRLLTAAEPFHHSWTPPEGRPLRIGIISGEIGSHCVSFFLLSLVLGARPEQAEFFIFPTKDRSSEPRWQLFQQRATMFECIEQLSDHDACLRIRRLNLDVVLETTQHMMANRLTLMANRLAPVQSHYIGMHGTTGVPAIDYFIGDQLVTPPEFAPHFTEKLLRLPRTWVCYTPPEEGLPPLRPTKARTPLRLGSFNNVSKISRECLRLWALVLLALPKATLLIKDSLRSGELDHQRNLIDYLRRRGVDPARITVVPRTESWEAHMDLYNNLDIALDTLPLTSGTTAYDALLMGVPLVAYSTPWIGGRLSASIVTGLGQPDWIADSSEAYVACVKTLAAKLSALRAGRESRRQQFLASELCDQHGLATAVVDGLRQAYRETQPA